MPTERPPVVLVSRTFVKRRNKRLLLLQRTSTDRHMPLKWECVGGKLELGEDISRTRENESMQEAGIFILPVSPLVYADSSVIVEGPYAGHTYVALFGIAEWVSGSIRLSDEHDSFAWPTYEELFDYDLTPEVRKAAIVLESQLR